jgi:hypothetical protein
MKLLQLLVIVSVFGGLAFKSTADSPATPVSIVADPSAGAPVRHGLGKLEAALKAKGVRYEEVSDPEAAQGQTLIVACLPASSTAVAARVKALGITVPSASESLVIHMTKWKEKPLLLLTGSDDRGLMYSLLEVADRIGWSASASNPLSEVRNTVESPSVTDRGVTIYTMQQARFEERLHDANYWPKYFDMMASDRFNSFRLFFGYDTDGYMCPAYPYFVETPGFPEVKVVGLSKEQQQSNASDLHRLMRMAHDRGIQVTLGFWCHNAATSTSARAASQGQPGKVVGMKPADFIPYTQAALVTMLREFHETDRVLYLMNPESGLSLKDAKSFWGALTTSMKEAGPNMQYEIRAKGVSDDIPQRAIDMGLKVWMNTKYWAEQVGLPFPPSHIQELNQFERRAGYADMLKGPREYDLHYTLWTSGTTRILLWGDPDYVKRLTGTLSMGGAQGEFDVAEPLATKMQGHPQDMTPFDLLTPQYRYYDYEFERYWHFFQVFGRLTYNPATLSQEWDHEFDMHYGKDAAPYVEKGLHRASQILPHITAYCLPPNRFSTVSGWAELQRVEDLGNYAKAEPSDIGQFESFGDAASDIVDGHESARISPMETSRWFAQASKDVLDLAAQAEQHAGPHPNKEFISTLVDLRILANLASYHAHRIPAGLSMALYQQTHDLNALDDAISHEKSAIQAWQGIVQAAGNVYSSDLMMGAGTDMSGSWKDQLVKLQSGLAALEQVRSEYVLQTRREISRYDLTSGPVLPGYQRLSLFNTTDRYGAQNGRNHVELQVPDGSYEVTVGIKDDKMSHGPMWIELNGVEYSDVFSVPAGQEVKKTMETSSVNGKLAILFDNATTADWYASTIVINRVDPAIAHVPVRKMAPGKDLVLRASVAGIAPVTAVRVYYGDSRHGFTKAEMERVQPQLYRAVIPASRISEGTSYFLEAEDSSGRIANYPDKGRANPIPVLVTADDQPPTLRQTPILTAKPQQPLRIVAQAQDLSGVKWVHLLYRGLSQHQDYQVLNMLPDGKPNEYEATIPAENIDPHFDLMYMFQVMDNKGNGKIYPDLAKETPYVVVKVDHATACKACAGQ